MLFTLIAYFAIFDNSYLNIIKRNETIPWKSFDQIIISCANLDNESKLFNENPNDESRIRNIISLYRTHNPNGSILISLFDERTDRFLRLDLKIFSQSVLDYLNKYKIDGLDLDWEPIGINSYTDTSINILKSSYGKKSITIWPFVHDPDKVKLLKDVVDQINIMSYQMHISKIEYLINSYNKSGFPYDKMVIGLETETTFENKQTIIEKVNLIRKYNLKSLFIWRLDNDVLNLFHKDKIHEYFF